MQISLSKLSGVVTGVVIIGMVGYMGYFLFVIFFKGPQVDFSPRVSVESVSIFSGELKKAAAVIVSSDAKIALTKKDLQFTEKDLYKSFIEQPATISLTESRGRADPFVPYVAP